MFNKGLDGGGGADLCVRHVDLAWGGTRSEHTPQQERAHCTQHRRDGNTTGGVTGLGSWPPLNPHHPVDFHHSNPFLPWPVGAWSSGPVTHGWANIRCLPPARPRHCCPIHCLLAPKGRRWAWRHPIGRQLLAAPYLGCGGLGGHCQGQQQFQAPLLRVLRMRHHLLLLSCPGVAGCVVVAGFLVPALHLWRARMVAPQATSPLGSAERSIRTLLQKTGRGGRRGIHVGQLKHKRV